MFLIQFLVPTFTKKNPNAAQFKINSLPAGKTKQDLINQFWRTNGAFLAPKNPIKKDDQGELDALYDMGYTFPLSMQVSPFLQPQVRVVKIILKTKLIIKIDSLFPVVIFQLRFRNYHGITRR